MFSAEMGNSYVSFQNRRFRSRDSLLEVWFRLLALNLPSQQYNTDSWIHDLRDEWLFQASGLWNGVVSPQLDKYCTSQERIDVVICASDFLMEQLDKCGDTIGRNELGLLGVGSFDDDFSVRRLREFHGQFRALLTDEVVS